MTLNSLARTLFGSKIRHTTGLPVRLSVRLSVAYELLTRKQKSVEKTGNDLNVFPPRKSPTYQFSFEIRSQHFSFFSTPLVSQ